MGGGGWLGVNAQTLFLSLSLLLLDTRALGGLSRRRSGCEDTTPEGQEEWGQFREVEAGFGGGREPGRRYLDEEGPGLSWALDDLLPGKTMPSKARVHTGQSYPLLLLIPSNRGSGGGGGQYLPRKPLDHGSDRNFALYERGMTMRLFLRCNTTQRIDKDSGMEIYSLLLVSQNLIHPSKLTNKKK